MAADVSAALNTAQGELVPTPCPICHGTQTRKTNQSFRTELHICMRCHQTFIVDKARSARSDG